MKKKKEQKIFQDFPETIYIVHHDDSDEKGYYLVFDDEIEAAEDAQENDSQLATYFLDSHAKARVDKDVVYVHD